MAPCPCGSGSDLNDCCGPVIAGDTPAPTAEALMRSRYTAFARGDPHHIRRTYSKETRDTLGHVAAGDPAHPVEWVRLEILGTTRGGRSDDTGTVDFEAHYRKDGKVRVHRERSTFCREEGYWVYVDGEVAVTTASGRPGKVGRNEPCPCGSGNKFKRCCGA